MKHFYIQFSLLILFFSFSFIKVSGQTTIWSEDFSTYTDKTINGENNGVTWSCYVDNGSVYTKPSYNSVKNEKIVFTTDKGGDYVWETSDINVSSYSSVKISVDLVSSDDVEGNESIRFYYSVDKGVSYQLFDTNSSHSGSVSSTIVASHTLATASNLRIKIVGEGFDYNDTYRFDNIVVIGEFDSSTEPIKSVESSISIWSEDFSTYTDKTINGENNGVTWSCYVDNGSVYTKPSYNSVKNQKIVFTTYQGGDYVWETSDINVSSYSSVKISVDLVSSADVEGNESIRFYYSVDKGVSYQLFDTNSSHSGSVSSTIVASHALSPDSNLRIKIVGKNFDYNDTYRFDNVLVYSVSAIPTINLAKAFDESCPGSNDGVIQFYETTPAIDSDLDFSIDGGSTWQTTPIFTGISVGTHNLRVRNAGGTNSADYPLSVGAASNLSITEGIIKNANCGFSDGSIDVAVVGGRSGSLQTDGSTGMVDLQTSFLTGLSAFTMEGWVKLNAARSSYTGQQSFFGQNDVIEFGFENGYYTCWTANGGKSRTGISNYPDDQEWHHVAVVGTGTSLSLYIDGEVVQTLNQTITSTTYGTNENYTVKIGAGVWNSSDVGNPFNGIFSDIRFWSDARTAIEIQDNMSQSLSGDEANLIAVYKMDTAPVDDEIYGIGSEATIGIVNSGAKWIDTDPVYFYSWTGPDSFVSKEEDLTALSAGTYELTVTDLNGCSFIESFNVEEMDSTDPEIPTLEDLRGECSATAVPPTTTDACAGTITGTTSDPLTYTTQGTHVITWNFDDGNGNDIDVTQNVVIKDVTDPVFQNPQADINVNTSEGLCGAIVDYNFPFATDNCSAYTGSIDGYTYLGEFNDHTYYYSSASVSIFTATQNAIDNGGHLLTITSEAENDFIADLVGVIWLGINDSNTEGTFQWLSGEDVVYENWNGGEPNDTGSNEDYTEMYENGLWNDISGTNSRRYVVEFEGALVTQTEGLSLGSVFPIGTTTNTYVATDNAGNSSTLSFNVNVADVTPPSISKLQADYYDGQNFDTFKESILVDQIDYDWGYGVPESTLVGKDHFSIRFRGNVQALEAGTYTFYTTSDDGVRLSVAGQSVVDNWTNHARAENSGTISLTAGQVAPIVLEFFENSGAAVIQLEWEGPGISRQFVKSYDSVSCEDITVDISDTGSYDLTVDEVDPGYSDACGIASKTLSKTDFTCDDIGKNAVTLTVTDVNGNSSECNFNVIVVGNVDASISLSSATGTDNQLLCINTDITNITYTVTNETGVTVSGLPAGVSGEYDSGTFTLSGTPTQSGAFLYSVIASGVCKSDTITGTIIVRALPVTPSIIVSAEDGSIISDNTVCAGNTTTISVDSTHFTDYSMHFDGVDDYVSVGVDGGLNYSSHTERTIMLWFKPEDITSRQVLYKEGNSSNGCVIYIKSDTIYAYGITRGATWSVASGVLTATDQWYHFAYTWNGASQDFKAYLNGNLVDTVTGGSEMLKNYTGNMIGSGMNMRFPDLGRVYDDIQKYYFKGNIDNFKLWNLELTQNQVISELSAEDVLVSDVVLNYDFNDYNDRNPSSVANSGSAGSAYIRGPVDKSSIDGPVYESSIVWDDPKKSTTFSINVNPTETTTYTATVSTDDACDRSVDVELIVNPIPKPIGIFFE